MTNLKALHELTFEETDDGYALHLSAEGGQTLSVAITPDQLDMIIDGLNEMLGGDDEPDVDET
ncbi:MAG: hypothetical protein Q8M88_04560 [Phenylobacterium sp.]|uniref:hypothetical protein n=1 Tax=Phenylobacterium sp. TaxID=1871053 RepID=UPI0027343195|nr:hypothetical protein [Phenylobacterium sp.]MDP3173688.1 hypothetical protein [Phenylobacterium sp.]